MTAKWPASGEKEENTLNDISFVVRPGQTLAVIGHVGAGKACYNNVSQHECAVTLAFFIAGLAVKRDFRRANAF